MSSTFRADVRAGLKSVLDTFKAANPSLLTRVVDHYPPAFHPPEAFVGALNEPTIRTDSGIRTRHMSAQVVVVHRGADNDSTSDQRDVLVDGLLDAFTAAPHTVPGSILTGEMSAQDVELEVGGVKYPGSIITVQAEIYEGRS